MYFITIAYAFISEKLLWVKIIDSTKNLTVINKHYYNR